MSESQVRDAGALWREVVELREIVRRGHFPTLLEAVELVVGRGIVDEVHELRAELAKWEELYDRLNQTKDIPEAVIGANFISIHNQCKMEWETQNKELRAELKAAYEKLELQVENANNQMRRAEEMRAELLSCQAQLREASDQNERLRGQLASETQRADCDMMASLQAGQREVDELRAQARTMAEAIRELLILAARGVVASDEELMPYCELIARHAASVEPDAISVQNKDVPSRPEE